MHKLLSAHFDSESSLPLPQNAILALPLPGRSVGNL